MVIIRPATADDKESVLELGRMSYPDGDYVQDVWDSWFAEGGTRVISKDGVCVASFNVSCRHGQGWVEGTRVHPDFRRRGFATAVLKYSERFVRDKKGYVVRSFIEDKNSGSLERSTKAGWSKGELWTWYRPIPDIKKEFHIIDTRRGIKGRYIDSWRVYDHRDCPNAVFFQDSTVATVVPSKHFPNTALVTVLEAGCGMYELAAYIQQSTDAASKHPVHGRQSNMHVISRLDSSLFDECFEKIGSYYLMSKSI